MRKLKIVISVLKQNIRLIKDFGMKLAFMQIVRTLIFRGPSKTGKSLERKIHEYTKELLLRNYPHIVDQYKNKDISDSFNKIESNSPIWIFWWQGIDQAPLIVKKCISNILKYSGTHEVIIVTKDNYSKYAEIPSYIIEKFEKGYITITHFSDILRMQLLYTHGGIWMDSTLYVTETITNHICEYSFYTIRHDLFSDYHVCKGLWTGFFLAGNKGNLAFKFFRDMFFEYWKNENKLICYLLIDCIISIGFENIPAIKKIIEMVPKNNQKVFEIEKHLSEEFSEELYKEITDNTSIFKVNYKKECHDKIDGKITFYGYLFNN